MSLKAPPPHHLQVVADPICPDQSPLYPSRRNETRAPQHHYNDAIPTPSNSTADEAELQEFDEFVAEFEKDVMELPG